jgi:hypothetical protein
LLLHLLFSVERLGRRGCFAAFAWSTLDEIEVVGLLPDPNEPEGVRHRVSERVSWVQQVHMLPLMFNDDPSNSFRIRSDLRPGTRRMPITVVYPNGLGLDDRGLMFLGFGERERDE